MVHGAWMMQFRTDMIYSDMYVYDSWINHTAKNHQITGIATDFNMDILLPGGGGGG